MENRGASSEVPAKSGYYFVDFGKTRQLVLVTPELRVLFHGMHGSINVGDDRLTKWAKLEDEVQHG